MMDADEDASTPIDNLHLLPSSDSPSQLNGQSLASAKVLFDTRRVKFSPPDNLKGVQGETSNHDVNRVLDHTHHLTSIPKSKMRSSLGQAVWLPQDNLALVVKRKGMLGFNRNGNYYLYPEEAAFAIDNCEYEITLDSLPVSLEEAFTIFFRSQHDQDIFRVYCVLRKHGFRVERFTRPSDRKEKCYPDDDTPMATSATSKREQSSQGAGTSDNYKKVKCNDDTDDCEMTDMTKDVTVKPLTLQMIYGNEEYFSHPMNLLLKHKCKDWKQFKNPSDIFEKNNKLTGSSVQFTQIPLLANVDHSLPPSALKTNSIEPIVKLDRFFTINQLLTHLQSKGPSSFDQVDTLNLSNGPHSNNCDEMSQIDIVFSVKTSLKHPIHVAVTSYRDTFPNFTQLRKLFTVTEKGSLVLAVVDECTVHFYKLTPFDLWQEVPVRWLNRSQ